MEKHNTYTKAIPAVYRNALEKYVLVNIATENTVIEIFSWSE
jgi:hypothetical protein